MYRFVKKYENISMGMSNDYKEAIICGATTVRIGSLIFGERKLILWNNLLPWKDASIFESLENLSKIKKSFNIKRIDFIENINLNDSLLILDDSSRGFIKLINSYSNKKRNNIIVTTKKENITLNSMQSLRFFFKPIKILDLYKEILNKIKNNVNNLDFNINHRDFSLTNKSGKILKLTEKEFKLIDVLIKNNGKAITKKNLLYLVWGLHL